MLGLSLVALYISWLIIEVHAAVKRANKEDRKDREEYERWKNRGKFFEDKNLN